MNVDRRDLFKVLGAGVAGGSALAQHTHAPAAAKNPITAPRVLPPEEFAVLQRLLEILLPADDRSPSARDAGVGIYIDTILHYADEKTRLLWREPLRSLGKTFLEKDEPDATETVQQMARNEANPKSPSEHFFILLKQTAIGAYYISDGGHKSLGYRGDIAIQSFPGCTHPEHKV